MKTTTALLALLLFAPVRAQAQKLDIAHLDRLAERADEVVNVTVTPEMLRIFSGFIPTSDKDAAAVKAFVGGLRGIFVKVFEFGSEKAYTADDITTIRKQLARPGWVPMVTVDSKNEGDKVDVYFWIEKDAIGGMAVIAADATSLTVVNIVGPIDPTKLIHLQGQFGIPALPPVEAPARKP